MSDIAALRYRYQYEYNKQHGNEKFALATDFFLRIYVSFTDWSDINKWDFEWVEEHHSAAERQYLIGVIHFSKLKEAEWFKASNIAVILMPGGIVEKEAVILRPLKKVSLQLSGVG